jgi:predicted RNA-binding protein with PUA-like domain
MQYWLVKSEPSTWSWQDQVSQKVTNWDGVRNFQARNYLQKMQLGDLCFFYHSVVGKQIMGVVKVSKTYMPDPSDESGKFGMVQMSCVEPLKIPVSLEQIKANQALQDLPLLKQSRLSVMPITPEQWQVIIDMAD